MVSEGPSNPGTTLMHGQFVWYELTTPDVDGAIKFYPKFTNWGTQPFDKDYTVWTTNGQPLGGIFRLTDEMRLHHLMIAPLSHESFVRFTDDVLPHV